MRIFLLFFALPLYTETALGGRENRIEIIFSPPVFDCLLIIVLYALYYVSDAYFVFHTSYFRPIYTRKPFNTCSVPIKPKTTIFSCAAVYEARFFFFFFLFSFTPSSYDLSHEANIVSSAGLL